MFSRPAIARLVVASGILASSLAVAVPAAHAKSGDVRKTVTCSKGSRATLKIGARDGVIETEFEVDSNVVGQRWSNTITDNGTTVFSGARKTTAPSGSFTIETRPANRPGTDKIVARSTFAGTGEVCSVSASV